MYRDAYSKAQDEKEKGERRYSTSPGKKKSVLRELRLRQKCRKGGW